jgi:hypothetical protein
VSGIRQRLFQKWSTPALHRAAGVESTLSGSTGGRGAEACWTTLYTGARTVAVLFTVHAAPLLNRLAIIAKEMSGAVMPRQDAHVGLSLRMRICEPEAGRGWRRVGSAMDIVCVAQVRWCELQDGHRAGAKAAECLSNLVLLEYYRSVSCVGNVVASVDGLLCLLIAVRCRARRFAALCSCRQGYASTPSRMVAVGRGVPWVRSS